MLDTEQKAQVRNLVYEFVDVCRVDLSRDRPAKVTTFKSHLKHDTVPRWARSRKHGVDHRNWMLKHVKPLEEMGFVYRNTKSRWLSPVMIVPKPKHPRQFRMVIDCRYPNSKVQPTGGFLPILEVSTTYFDGGSWFGSLDALKGFWQFPLDSE